MSPEIKVHLKAVVGCSIMGLSVVGIAALVSRWVAMDVWMWGIIGALFTYLVSLVKPLDR